MASKRGPLVFFKRVRRKATPASPYLKPAGERGLRLLDLKVKKVIATSRSLEPKILYGRLEQAVRETAFATLQVAQRKVRVSTGRLRASLNARKVSSLIWSVGTNVSYARFVEEGTREGTRSGPFIYPRRGKVLAFHWRKAPPAVRARFRGRRRRRG